LIRPECGDGGSGWAEPGFCNNASKRQRFKKVDLDQDDFPDIFLSSLTGLKGKSVQIIRFPMLHKRQRQTMKRHISPLTAGMSRYGTIRIVCLVVT
jgi:hypothetical protein